MYDVIKIDMERLMEESRRLTDRYRFGQEDAKLHDVSLELFSAGKYAHLSNGDSQDIFNMFCEDEASIMDDYLRNNSLELEYIGRTSSFYITNEEHGSSDAFEPYYFRGGVTWSAFDVAQSAEEAFAGADDIELELADDIMKGVITSDDELFGSDIMSRIYGDDRENFDEDRDEILDGIENVINGAQASLTELSDALGDIDEAYRELERFKLNQVEIFEDWYASQQ